MTKATKKARTYKGAAIAGGVAVGKARIVDTGHFPSQVSRYSIPEIHIEREVKRLKNAASKAAEELRQLADKVEEQLGRREAEIIRPQALMVQDPVFIAEVEELIIEDRVNAEAAVAHVMQKFENLIASIEDRYLRERSTDVRDAGRRVLAHLLFVEGELMPQLTEPSVVVCNQLLPSVTVHLDRENILGFAAEHGGYTSHAAILARSLGVPAVTGLDGLCDEVMDGETIIVDGVQGVVVVRPGGTRLARSKRLADHYRAERQAVVSHAGEPVVTPDGAEVSVRANIGREDESELALTYGADGIGLYRTEFDFLSHSSLPSEDVLAEEYGRIAEAFGQKGVAIRVLDIGGDKFPPAIPLAHEANPFLGLRGLRLLMQHVDDILRPQLRAIARASARGRIGILYPMVAGLDDLAAAREVFEEVAAQVAATGCEPAHQVEQGIMIEVPSCIPLLPRLLERCDFATVGTNDLVQYMLAASRISERMIDAYDAFHPAIIQVLQTIRQTGAEKDKEVSVCGEVAGDVTFLPLLLGLGYRSVSVNVGAVPYVKQAVRRMNLADCEALADEALRADTAARIRLLAEEFHKEHFPPR